MRTDFTDELDEVELIARDRRVVQFPEVPDLGDDGTDFDSREQCFIGRVDPQCGKVREHLVTQFVHVIHECRPVVLQRGIDDRGHERIVLDRRDLFKMLLHTFHGRAGFRTEQCRQIVVTAFDRTLQDRTGIGAVPIGEIVVTDRRCRAVRSTQPRGKTTRQVQQGLRDVVAVVTQCHISILHRLLDQVVERFLQQCLK